MPNDAERLAWLKFEEVTGLCINLYGTVIPFAANLTSDGLITPEKRDLILSWHDSHQRMASVAARAEAGAELAEALSELLEVADLRGDSSLPHPADDPKLWTARMQDAWGGTYEALDKWNSLEGAADE